MDNPTPNVIELTAITSGYIVEPRTPCFALQFNTVQDIAVRFRYRAGQPWINVTEGDFYNFGCVPVQTGIEFDLSTPSGPSPSVVVQFTTYPDGLGVD